jgi:hypothetical protein
LTVMYTTLDVFLDAGAAVVVASVVVIGASVVVVGLSVVVVEDDVVDVAAPESDEHPTTTNPNARTSAPILDRIAYPPQSDSR